MLILLIILIVSEAFSLAVLRQHFMSSSKIIYYILLILHLVLSIWLWITFTEINMHDSFFDRPDNVWLLTAFSGMVAAVVFPRIILIIFHYTGRLLRHKKGGSIRWLTYTGFGIATFIFIVVATGTIYGRFNFQEDDVTINIKDLNKDLDGLKIVQISDLHLSSFYHHTGKLKEAIDRINLIKPDIIFNTGDFTTFGWREFGRNDTILKKAVSRYGNFAITGNHDAGTYNPDFTEADRHNNVLIINNLVRSSGYTVLNDENRTVTIGNARITIAGVTTTGRHRNIVHGNIDKALDGADSADLMILLTHDPNHWTDEIAGKKKVVDLTFSGHTHGMQMGILTEKFKWSPSQYFYPDWNGLYSIGNQQHYVNRGLGILAVPFRIWMPPEISVITLKSI